MVRNGGVGHVGALALAGVMALTAPLAASVPRFDELYIFGDSLSDPGNLFALTQLLPGGPLPPSPPYFDGRVSDGPVWADLIAQDYAAAGRPVTNYAFAFGRVISPTEVDLNEPASFLPINLGDQIASFVASTAMAPANSAAILLMGANDAFQSLRLAADEPPGTPGGVVVANIAARAQAAVDGIAAAAATLRDRGVGTLVLMNLPDLGQVPAFSGDPGSSLLASLATLSFNTALAAETFPGMEVERIDVAGLFAGLLADPGAFGLTGLGPCLDLDATPMTLCDNPTELAFFDRVHPNSVVHAALAAEVRQAVAIPLPAAGWLLLGGLALLAGAARRRV